MVGRPKFYILFGTLLFFSCFDGFAFLSCVCYWSRIVTSNKPFIAGPGKCDKWALPRCKNLWNSPVTKEVNIIDPNPNNSYKTKKKFTCSYTEVNPKNDIKHLVFDFPNHGRPRWIWDEIAYEAPGLDLIYSKSEWNNYFLNAPIKKKTKFEIKMIHLPFF